MEKSQAGNDEMYDIVIIGSGLGSLLCAVVLAKEGKKVCVLEKNRQIGGCLQTFAFQKKAFDSCVHYIGGLGKGHTLYKIFDYAGIMEKLQLQALDENGFDRIAFSNETIEYPQAIGNTNFIEQLLPFFPDERVALMAYLDTIKSVTSQFPLYNLRNGDGNEKAAVTGLELIEVLDQITSNDRLKKVLAGNNLLYAGIPGKTPFYLHALVLESYMHSAHKVVPGSSEIAKLLWKEFQKLGGEIFRKTEIVKLVEENGQLQYAQSRNGQRFYSKQFIAGIHPGALLPMIESSRLRPVFRQRIASLEQTPSAFMLNIVLKKETIKYRNHNIYWHPDGNVFPEGGKWPATKAFFFTKDPANPGFADTLTILQYGDYSLFKDWETTFNNTAIGTERNKEYAVFKEKISQQIVAESTHYLPELKTNIAAYSLATPLTYRDYTGTPEGSLYGILKDVNQPAKTTIAIRTKIPNLLLTGQNVNLHGVLGVSITALATCAELLGMDYLLEKIMLVDR